MHKEPSSTPAINDDGENHDIMRKTKIEATRKELDISIRNIIVPYKHEDPSSTPAINDVGEHHEKQALIDHDVLRHNADRYDTIKHPDVYLEL